MTRVADEDPRRGDAERRIDDAVGRIGTTATSHRDEVGTIVGVAWGSCVRGRVRSLKRWTGTKAVATDVGTERLHARVAAQLALGWVRAPEAITLDGGGRDDVLRVQMAVGAALLRAADHPSFAPAHAAVIRGLCPDEEAGAYLNVALALRLASQAHPAWLALDRRLDDYVREVDEAEEARFRRLSVQRTRSAFALDQVGTGSVATLFTSANTVNLFNAASRSRVLRERDDADVDVFVKVRVGDAQLGADATPMMLGAFPHAPSEEDRRLDGLDVDGLFGDSISWLDGAGHTMRTQGFDTTAPLMDRAVSGVERRLAAVVRPPSSSSVAPEPDLRTIAADVDRFVEDVEDQADARQVIAGAAHELLTEQFDRVQALIDVTVGVKGVQAADAAPASEVLQHLRAIVAYACREFEARQQPEEAER